MDVGAAILALGIVLGTIVGILAFVACIFILLDFYIGDHIGVPKDRWTWALVAIAHLWVLAVLGAFFLSIWATVYLDITTGV
jgi:hypothetical protein